MGDSEESAKIPFSMWRAALLITCQSFLFGYCFSCLNSCLVTGDKNSASECYHGDDSTCPKGTIYNDMQLSTMDAQLATSLIVVGAWIGCMIGSKPSEMKGRRFTCLANNIFFLVGAALTTLGNKPSLFVGRFVLGVGVGVTSVVPPVLLNEIADEASKGIITTLHQLMITLAIFIASIVAYGFVTYVNHGWQYIQAFAAIPAIFMLIFKDYVPESPKWILSQKDDGSTGTSANPLQPDGISKNHDGGEPSVSGISKQKYEHVSGLLKSLRADYHDVDSEIRDMLAEIRQSKETADNVTWSEVFQCRKAVIIGCGLMFFQAMTGINSVVFYSTTIFSLAGFSQSIIGTALFGIVNFLMTFVAANLIDKMGRKILLLGGTYTMLFALVLLSGVLLAPIDSTAQGAIAVVAVLIFVAGFAVGLGAVCWSIMAEIMPTRLRVKAVSLFLSINWGCNLVIGLLSLTAIDDLGQVEDDMTDDETADAQKKGVAALYLMFAGFAALALLFMHIVVPETKGKSPDEFTESKTPLLDSKQ